MWPYPKETKLRLIKRAIYNKDTGCLEWTGATASGYGQVCIIYKNYSVHRVLLEIKLKRHLKHNEEGLHVCNNTLCISTAKNHVKAGSHRENMRQAYRSGRRKGGETGIWRPSAWRIE